LVIERIRASTLVPAGTLIFSDDELRAIFRDTEVVLSDWLAEKNRGLSAPQQVSTLTLDFELKKIAAGWPTFISGQIEPAGLVLKQSRPLEPGLRQVPEFVKAQAFPRDLLARASRVVHRICPAEDHLVEVWTAVTDPLADPDFGFSESPFVASVRLTGPTLDLLATHRELGVRSVSPENSEQTFALEATGSGSILGLSILEGDHVQVETSSGAISLGAGECTVTVELATPEDYLRSLLEGRDR
jgi:hypothetical protein